MRLAPRYPAFHLLGYPCVDLRRARALSPENVSVRVPCGGLLEKVGGE